MLQTSNSVIGVSNWCKVLQLKYGGSSGILVVILVVVVIVVVY